MRRIRQLALATSIAASLAMIALNITSLQLARYAVLEFGHVSVVLSCSRGTLTAAMLKSTDYTLAPAGLHAAMPAIADAASTDLVWRAPNRRAFVHYTIDTAFSQIPGEKTSIFVVRLPALWSVAPLSLPLFLADWRRQRRENRLGRGECARCGFDLRSTPERCPECGAVSQKSIERTASETSLPLARVPNAVRR